MVTSPSIVSSVGTKMILILSFIVGRYHVLGLEVGNHDRCEVPAPILQSRTEVCIMRVVSTPILNLLKCDGSSICLPID